MIRKFAYNILRIAIIKSGKNIGVQEMMDEFDASWSLVEQFVFSEIEALN